MANPFDNPYITNTWTSISNSFLSGAASGVGMLSFLPGANALYGLILGGITAGLTAWQDQTNLKENRNLLLSQREELTRQRNRYISSAQRSISSFRTEFDNSYGEGMFDTYDALFSKVLDLPSGSDTVLTLLSSLSLDNVSGVIGTEVGGKLSEEALTGVISASDINSKYLEYMQNQIQDSETAIGLQFRSQTLRERSILSSYYDSIDQYNLAVAKQFSDAFFQQRQTNIGLAESLGQAETAQAASGIRQTGSGNNQVLIQKFQSDMSNAAYYSTLNYAIRQYEGQMSTMNTGLSEQIAQIRNENAQLTEQLTNEFFSTMNDYYGGLVENYYYNILDAEEGVEELNKDIADHSEAIWFENKGEMHQSMDDYF